MFPQMPFNITSIGLAAQQMQVHPRRITELAKSLGISAVGKINGIDHYSAADVERILDHVRRSDSPSVVNPRNPMN